ncbi:TonB-dependent Receptor Plug Domain protein [Tsuneonella dongtanensis]|uniref:TonB-dependent Receptor Plug Domain protein n=1 Tax=Tsuneonella dongtanensis TaxID=692370 RepID=A0A1B2AAZ2_9SPHN|nr:TonB-dependent Receptor Plug Domain protein [Tsuneonella dongtanensis]
MAEDIGKLPDITAVESLARITGVQVNYGEGGADGTRVRGLPDLTTTYNGREIFTAQGRAVALQDFPTSGVARIDVYKSATANLVEPGIAGLIDVRSRRPLDFRGDRIAGAIGGAHWYQSQRLGIEANVLVSKRWETGVGDMGLLVEGSYTDINFLDSLRINALNVISKNQPGLGTIYFPAFVNVKYPTADRWRPAVNSSFQWKPNSDLEFYADFLFQGFRGRGNGKNFLVNSGVQANLSNVVLLPDSNLVQSMTAQAGGQTNGNRSVITAKTDTYQAGSGLIYTSGPLRLSGDVAWTDSTYTQKNINFNYQINRPIRDFTFDSDVGEGGGAVLIQDIDLFDPSNYYITALRENGDRNHGRDLQGRLDAFYSLRRGLDQTFRTSARRSRSIRQARRATLRCRMTMHVFAARTAATLTWGRSTRRITTPRSIGILCEAAMRASRCSNAM